MKRVDKVLKRVIENDYHIVSCSNSDLSKFKTDTPNICFYGINRYNCVGK